MSFSSDIKEELSRTVIHDECCKISELTGFLITNCNIVRENKEFTLKMSTENATAVRRAYNTFKSVYGILPITNIEKEKTFKESLYQLKIIDKNDLEKIFTDSMINIDVSLNIVIENTKRIKEKECCMKSFLRGVFIGAGSISDPTNMYHLEIVTNNMQNATFINELLNDYELKARIIKRKKDFVVYLKGAESISNFLAIIGANKGIISFEETRVIKEVRNRVNRLNNFENANYDKTLDTSMSQVEDIKLIKNRKAFAKLSKQLKEIANLRLEYQEKTYEELGQLLEPKLSRAGVSHRFRRIKEIADDLRSK